MKATNNTSAKTTKVTFVQLVLNAIRKPQDSSKVVAAMAVKFPKKNKTTIYQNTHWYLSNLVSRKLAKVTKDGQYVCIVK